MIGSIYKQQTTKKNTLNFDHFSKSIGVHEEERIDMDRIVEDYKALESQVKSESERAKSAEQSAAVSIKQVEEKGKLIEKLEYEISVSIGRISMLETRNATQEREILALRADLQSQTTNSAKYIIEINDLKKTSDDQKNKFANEINTLKVEFAKRKAEFKDSIKT